MKRSLRLFAALVLRCAARPLAAQTLSGGDLVKALRHGGYVLVMRHASSPEFLPTQEAANPDNKGLERQLDEKGRAAATDMGKALHDLAIPVGDVLTSPAYRALETARLAHLAPQPTRELGDPAQSMQKPTAAQAKWLQDQAARHPTGKNTIIITHIPMIAGAFPQWASGLADGEALVLGAGPGGDTTLVARIKIEEWPTLKP
jgi:phosphohistidine phosphatase SixA